MKTYLAELRGAILATLVLTLVTCGLYPLAVWGIAQAAFPNSANGSLIRDQAGLVRGSRLLGQGFTATRYFHPRPSAAGAHGYDATSSGGSNLGPTSRKLRDALQERILAYRTENGLSTNAPVPADAVTASGSGLDPHITPANAHLQAPRVAQARRIPLETVRQLIGKHSVGPDFGLLGEARVNVLELNLALDQP
jgi:K+-transporting ATPase ATPase C chain